MHTYNRNHKNVLPGYKEVSQQDYLAFTEAWMRESYRLLKPSGSCFVFSGWNNLKDILLGAEACGFTLINHIIWKFQFGVVCRRKFVSSHYHCLYLCKDPRQRQFHLNSRFTAADKNAKGGSARYQDLEDVWEIKREYWPNRLKTPTKLPRELIEKILAYASVPQDIVFDPFLGSGQVAVVALLNQRQYAGFEIVQPYYDFAATRLARKTYFI